MRNKVFYVVCTVILVLTAYVCGVLFYTAIVKGEYYRSKANTQQLDSFAIHANRGTIYDTNNKILAQSSTVWTVIISPGDINKNEPEKRELIVKTLSEILDVDYEKLNKASLDFEKRYYIVKNKVEKPQVDEITAFMAENELNSFSITLSEDSKRYYPNDTLAASIIGFTNYDNEGVYGIEAYYDEYLQGVDGRVVTAKDASGNAMPYDFETRYEATNGNSLVLTLDSVLQHYLEKNLDAAVSQHKVANRATGIIMNCKTGAILAMATSPGFNLNQPASLSEADEAKLTEMELALKEAGLTEEEIDEQLTEKESVYRETQWKNKAITELYYPGSVFKVITCASALEEEVVDLSSTFYCPGVVTVADTQIHCWSRGGHGTLALQDALTKSCNPAFIEIGQRLGVHKFSSYLEAFGFTQKTGIDLPGETGSLFVSEDRMGPVELASSSFGQTNKITPIQMICAYAAVINGGNLVTPYIVDKIIDDSGNVIKTAKTQIKRQVISEETSKQMRSILKNVVETNGGTNAYISGYSIGGKSGTSEKIDDYNYANMRYVSTFCAFTPAEDPEIIMLVVVDEPMNGQYYGSAVAAPVVSAVFKESLEYLGIYPQYTAEELAEQNTTVPYLINYSSLEATTKLNTLGLNARFIGDTESGSVLRTVPGAGMSIPRDGTVVIYLEEGETLTTTVPDVTGYTVAQANNAITNAGLNISLSGGAIDNDKAIASYQSVEAGSEVNQGTVVEVSFIINDETG